NLALGSDLADQLLTAVGARLEQNAPPGALVARLRSDEFAILLPGMTIEAAEASAENLMQQFRQPFRTGPRDVVLPISIGVAALVSGQETASELLRNADLALQAAKAGGKAKYQRFEPAMRQTRRADAA
ncbi:MAG TPA: GGDEF domain-containing protein, partial [Candidatus Acidoferrum sp.]|nr:GGDEF domain-containing protein [Candidatus Acidoferrum sp.]